MSRKATLMLASALPAAMAILLGGLAEVSAKSRSLVAVGWALIAGAIAAVTLVAVALPS